MALLEIVEYMLTTYEPDLGTSRARWRGDLIEKAGLAPNTVRALLDGTGGNGRQTKEKLAQWFKLIPGWEEIRVTWLDAESLEHFLELHNRFSKRATTRLELEIPRHDEFDDVAKDIIGHFVTYRYAFETVTDHVAREVVTFRRDGDKLLFDMSYKLGDHDADQPLRMFSGTAGVVGASVMGIATSTAPLAEGRQKEVARARSLFFTHDVNPKIDDFAKFGILTSTKISHGHEPCAACVVMLRVGAKIDDLKNYRDRVTIIRPFPKFMETDFAEFSPEVRDLIAKLLDNNPRKHENGHQDRVVKLWFDRFGRAIQSMQSESSGKTITAPWTAAWEDGLLSDRSG